MKTDDQLMVRWQYHAGEGAIVWQMMFTGTGDLIGQKRLPANRQALFFGIEPSTGELFCDNYLLMDHTHSAAAGDGWFTGLESVCGELCFCYACQPGTPEHQGVWAVDIRAGRVAWSRADISFVANLGDALLVTQSSFFGGFPERHFLLVDPFTGIAQSQAVLESAQVHSIRQSALPEEIRQRILLPELVLPDMVQEHPALEHFCLSGSGRCEYLQHGLLSVVVWHEESELSGFWHSVLKVWRKDCLIYEDCMEERAEKPCLNNFLVQDNNLYYIREKEELLCIALS